MGLPALLAGRASQHARDCERGHVGRDLPCRHRNPDDPRRCRRNHAAESLTAGHRRAIRHPGKPVSGPHRSWTRARAGLRSDDCAGAAAQSRVRSGAVSPGRDGVDGIPGTGGARSTRHRVPGGRHPSADLDPGFQLVRRASRRGAGPAVCVRIAFRARHDAAGHRHLPRPLPGVRAARASAPHAGFQYFRGGIRCAGAVSINVDAAGLREPAQRPADAIAASGRGIS